jgi:hypothetical protein
MFEFGDVAFDPETLAILEGVFDEAWASNDGWFSQDAFAHGESAEFPFPVHPANAPAQPIRRVPFV